MSNIELREVCCHDVSFVFSLANDSVVRKTAFTTQKILWEDHVAWFEKQLRNGNPFYIIYLDEIASGYVRFENNPSCSTQLVITVAIVPEARGRGVAKAIIPLACEKAFVVTGAQEILAKVKNENIASANLFIGCGFDENASQSTYRVFSLTHKWER